ncbi:MAG: hypothetical protein H5U08_10760, partial [Thermogutta sp.]|nr:hypothetical protein [Thermogutta sp.]
MAMQIADMSWRVRGRALTKRMTLVIGLLLVLAWSKAPPVLAAEYEVVGALAYAVEPDVAKEIGLTENQLKQLNDLINNAEAEILTTLSELKDLSPQERSAKLAQFRRGIEDQGLALLSVQQRAKLEQIRLKRLGEKFFADPVIAEKLGLTEEQKAALSKALAERPANSGSGGASENPALSVLNDSQRKTLRAMLLGELVKSESSGSQASSEPAGSQPQGSSSPQPSAAPPSESTPPATIAGEHPAEMPAEGPATVSPPAGEASQSETPVGAPESTPAATSGAQPAAPASEATASASPAPTAPAQPGPQETPASPTAQPQGSAGSSAPPSVSATPANQATSPETSSQSVQTEENSVPPVPAGPNATPAVSAPTPTPSPPPPGTPMPAQVGTETRAAPPAAQPPAPTQESQFPQLPPRDVKLRFNFRYQPWK